MNLKWKVGIKPTGQYRSFSKREWPSGYINGHPAFYISSKDEYIPAHAKTGNHEELVLHVAKYEENGSWQWRRFVTRFPTLSMAKDFAKNYLKNHPDRFSACKEEKEIVE